MAYQEKCSLILKLVEWNMDSKSKNVSCTQIVRENQHNKPFYKKLK